MKVSWRVVLILLSVITLLLGGCSQNTEASAEEIIHNAIESEKDVNTYQGKAEMKMYEGEEMTQHTILEEYVEGEKRKIVTNDPLLEEEVEVLNDGTTMYMYDKTNNQASEMDMTELGDFASLSPKDQFKGMMEMMKDSHTYEVVGDEKVLDYDTYHIQVKAKEADNLLGDMELWVDQKTWFVVKLVSETGDTRTEFAYTELDFSPEFADETFTLDIPDDVEIANLEESFAPDAVTLEEAEEALGQPFLVFPEEEFILSSMQMYDFSAGLDRHELELMYSSKEDIPMFSLSIFPTPDDMPVEADDLEIRGNAAEYEEMINSIHWDEDGLRYMILITNPDVEQEEVVKSTENMISSSEK
ncbi:outer membrane lipoprotein carrier protein LolA [Oceanobacillus longus]|uniref:Outer membrane lipoprotein carrier protein LolA n=1 Tax=Oceanobacillus longus TaxID=930120 RepID=A0ABV8H025_9BACI